MCQSQRPPMAGKKGSLEKKESELDPIEVDQ